MLLSKDEKWKLHHGDCISHMAEMEPKSVDFSVYSPPYPSVYSYTSSVSDIGNSEDIKHEAKLHFGFFFRQIIKVIKPGRAMVVHCTQIVNMKRTGGAGMFDFRGLLIRLGQRAGFVYEYDWMCRKNPQALRNGSRVLTPHGWVPIECLLVGSQAIGSKGNPVNVVGVHPQGIRSIYRVTTSDGASVDCDGRHLWAVRTTKGVSCGKKPIILTTDEMRERGLFMPSGEPRFYLPVMEAPAEFTPKSRERFPVDPYILGVLLGDGMLSTRGSVGVCTQRGIVEQIQLPHGHAFRFLPGSEKGNDVCSWHIISGEWHRNDVLSGLRCLGLDGLRAWEKFIPDVYLFADEMTRRQVLAGLLDTDGGNKKGGGIKYNTTSIRLAEGFRFIVESLGGLCSLVKRKGGAYNYKGERLVGRDIYELTPRLRDGICPFKFPEKAAQWELKKPHKGMRRPIVSIDAVGQHPCTCITVDAADGLFVTENCLVTHNSQAIRTHSHELQFAGLERDRAKCRGTMNDYLIKFRAPGENAVPVCDRKSTTKLDADGDKIVKNGREAPSTSKQIHPVQVSRNQWIDWAEGCWWDIKETDTLNVKGTKGKDDTKHIAPLQLGVIERLILLFTNPGEIVFSPFCGIGSEGWGALKLGRRFYGVELKDEYVKAARINLDRAVSIRRSRERTLLT